ncbi:MAG: hypothetical protein Q7J06_02580, partial [Bacteroidales bacterium]|nr:hypothetical protein [Bacteroidales bacterium]
GLKNTLNFLNPENILKRGFTITSLNGMIIRISDQLNTDDLIDTQFSDGSVRSRIIEKRGRKEEREKGRKED